MKESDKKLKKAMFKLSEKSIGRVLNKCDLHNVIVLKGTFCSLYNKECMGTFCSVTPEFRKCKYFKEQNAL